MSYAPFRENTQVYKGTTFGFSFTIDEDGSPLDLTTLNKVEAKLFSSSNDVFSFDTNGDLTISGASNNIVSGVASESTMDIAKRIYYLELWLYFSDGSKEAYSVIDVKIIDAESDESQGAHDWVLDIDNDSETVTGQATSNLAEAIQAKEDAETAQAAAEQAESDTQNIADQALIDITNAKDSALSEISTAETDAITAIEQAETDGITAVNNARDQGVTAVENARDSAISDINNLVTQAENARDAAQTAQQGAETAETNAETSATNAATSETNAAASETESQDNADDAEKQAQNTTSFTDSDGNSFDKGAKGYANDAETSANNAEATAEEEAQQRAVDAHGYYAKELSNIKERLRTLENA